MEQLSTLVASDGNELIDGHFQIDLDTLQAQQQDTASVFITFAGFVFAILAIRSLPLLIRSLT